MESKADILYKQLIKDGYTNLGTPEEFKIKVKNRDKADLLFKQLTKDGYTNLGSFDDFYSKVSQAVPVKKKEQQAPAKNQDGTESKSVTGLSEQPGINPFGIGKKVRNKFETTLKAVELGVTPLELKNAQVPVEEIPKMDEFSRAALSVEPVRYRAKTFEEKTKDFAIDENTYIANKKNVDDIILPPEAMDYLHKNRLFSTGTDGAPIFRENAILKRKLKSWYALNPEGQKEYEFHQKVLNHGRDVIDKAEEIVNQKIIEATDEWRASMVQEAQYDPTGKNVYTKKPDRLIILEAEAEKIKNARKALDAYKDAKTASTAMQIWNQIGRQIGGVAADAASFGLIPLSKDLTYYELKKKQDEGKPLTEDEKRLLDTSAYAEYIARTYAGTSTFAQDAVTAIGQSIPYMVSFASLGGLAKMATKTTTGALKASTQLIARQGLPNAMARVTGAQTSAALQVASKLTGAVGNRGAAVIVDAIDNFAKAGVQVMIDPRTYDKTIKNMTGDVGFDITDEGKVTFTGFEGDLSFPQALTKAYISQMVENLSEYSGGILGTVGRPLSKWTNKNIPALSKMVNKTKFTGATKKFMDAAGYHGILPEFFEEQLATIGHAITGDGEGDWKDLTDPRQQLLTLTTVAAIGSGASMASAGIRKIGKDTAEFAFNDAINDLKAEFGDDFVELGKSMTTNSVTVNQESLREILDNPGYSNKQKMAAYNYYVAGNRYYAYKENFDEEAAKKSEEEQLEELKNTKILENVLMANKGMGYEQAVEIANAEIDLRSLADNNTESGNVAKQNIKKFIQDAIQKSKTEGGVLRYEQSEMGLQEVGKRDEGQKPSETSTQEKEVRPREAVIAEIKQTDTDMETRIAEAQQRLGLPTIVPVAISEETEVTLDMMDNDEPVANEFVEKASAELYERYQELEKMKASDTRQFTVEQIDSMMEFIGEEITKLENYATKQRETGEFVRPSEVGTTTQRRAEEAPDIPATEEVTLAAPVAATEVATPQSAPEVAQESPAAEVTQAEVSTPAPKEKIARRKTPSTIQFDAPVVRQEVLQSLKLTFPDVEVVMDSDLEAAQQAVKEKLIAKGVSAANAEEVVTGMTADSGRIFNVKGKPAIIFLNPLLMNDRTIGHEFWHGILTDAFGENQPMFEKFQKAIDKRLRDSGYKAVADKLTSFAEGYEPGQLDFEEYLAEFGGYLTQEGFNTDKLKASEKSILMQIKQVINKFAKSIFGQNVFMEDATAENILEFMIAASEKMKAGEAVPTKRGTRADGQGATTRAQAYDGIVSGVNSVISFINDNNVLDNSGLSTFKAQKANDFMSLSEKTNLYKKAFGERASRAIRDMMPIAFDMQDKLIPYLKELIPIKSHTEFIIKNYGTVIQKKFIDKVLGGGQIVTQNEIRNPEDVLKSVGYKFSYTKNESDILGFRGYYPEEGRNGVDVICTFNDPGGRAKANYVVFIVKDDATTTVRAQDLTQDNLNDSWKKYLEEKGRKNEDGTYNLEGIGNNREDPFSTSVLSIQIPKRGGNAKIISRYNHTISEGSVNPDATFGGDLNKIADGLTSSMENYFGLRINEKTSNDLPDFITQDDEGRLFNYEKEVNGIYYGVDFYIKDGIANILDIGKERILDGQKISQSGDILVITSEDSVFDFISGYKKISFLQDNDIEVISMNGKAVFSTKNASISGVKYIDKAFRNNMLSNLSSSLEIDNVSGNITIGTISRYSTRFFKILYDTDIVKVDGDMTLESDWDINPFKSIVSVTGQLHLDNTNIKSLEKLKYVGKGLIIEGCEELESFGDLMYVGKDIHIEDYHDTIGNQIEADNLIYVGISIVQYSSILANRNRISSLKNLTSVGSVLNLQDGVPINSLPKLKYVGARMRITRNAEQSSFIPPSTKPSEAIKEVAPEIEYIGSKFTIDGIIFQKPSFDVDEDKLHKELLDDANKRVNEAIAKKGVSSRSQKANILESSLDGQKITDMSNKLMIEAGLIVHGSTSGVIGKVDVKKVAGGLRAVYGWGTYFTDSMYKYQENGGLTMNTISTIVKNEYNFLDTNNRPSKRLIDELRNAFSDMDMRVEMSRLQDSQNNTRSSKEYYEIEKEIDDIKKKIDKLNNSIDALEKDAAMEFIKAYKKNDTRSIDDIRKIALSNLSSAFERPMSTMFIRIGHDGFVNENQYVVFNMDKMRIVPDPAKYIADVYASGENSKLNKTADELVSKSDATAKSQKQERSKSNYELVPGYGQLIDKVNIAIQKAPYQREEGKEKLKAKRLETYYEQMLEMLGGDMAYAAMTDTQREEFVIRMREMIGLSVTPSPSTMIPRMLGHIKDIKNVTMDELELLKLKLTSEIRGVKNYNKARDKAWNQISQELKDMVSKNTIAQKQAINILRKFQKTNLLDEIETEKFLDYVAKVFADSNYVEYISSMNKKRSVALSNLKDKVGNATAFIDLATKMLSINPELITLRSISRYTRIVNILGSNRSVLPLQDRDEMMSDMIDVIQTVEETYEHALNLAITFAEFEDKVYDEKTGNLSFARTIAKMLENQVDELGNVVPGVIDQYDYDIMKKYRSVILSEYYGVIGESEEYQRASQEQKDELKRQREEEAAAFRKRIIYTIIKSDVSEDNLENVESRKSARELIALIKNRNYLERMSTTDLKILSSVLSNINDGFFPHSAQKMKEKMKAIGKAIDAVDVFERIKMGTFSGIRARIKSKFSKNESAYYSLIVSNPMGVIDEALGNFKGREVYNTFIKDMASGYSVYKSEYDDIQTMLDKSLDSLAKEAGGNMNKMVERQFFMMAYALQREYENNKGSRQVVSPFATIEETIKSATSDVSYYGEREAKILQDILTKFGKDDNVTLDADAMYQEMSPVEKDFMDNILPKINASLAPKASYTAGVLRDNAIGLLNNYIHHTVLGVGKKASQAIIENKALSEVNTFINSMKPSTRSKLLIERDGKVHPIMFNIYAAASASAKSVLLDFHMTEPARVINRTTHNVLTEMRLRENESRERQKGGADANTEQAVRDKIKQVREIMGAVDTAVEQVLRDTVMAAVGHETAMERALNAITKQGIRSMLGSARRAMQELGSNVLYLTHYTDVAKEALSKNMSDYTYTHEGRYVMEAVGSSNIQRLYPSWTISGSMVEASQIGAYYGIKQGRTINPTVNAMLTIHNLSTKKVKNFAENVADALISTPDRFLSRQVWFGSFGTEFRRLTGEDVNMEKVKEQDEEYMTVYGEQLQAAKDYADLQSIRASATDNPFLGIIKTTIEPASKNWFMTFFKTFDKFLIRFQIFEFSAARAGIMSMVGKGMMSKEDGFRLLSAVMMRSMGYATLGILTKQAMSNLVVGMFGLKGDDEESDKDVSQAVTQGFFTALISFMLGRNLGNTWRGAVNYPVELMNQKYFSGIIRGDREYDMYKDQVTYSFIPAGDLRGKDVAWETAKSMTAGYSPLVKAISYSAKKGIYVFSGTSKDRAAYERALKDLYIRTPLEILGLAGYIPLYNDIRKVTLDVLYDDLKGNEKKEPYKSEAEKNYLKAIGK